MTNKKGLSFAEVKSCLKSRAWKNFPLSKLSERVEEARKCLSSSQHDPTLVYKKETTNHILAFFKPFCLDVKRKKLTVQNMIEKLLEEPPQIQNSMNPEHEEAKRRVLKEIRNCFAGDKNMYQKTLFG